jgi:hypothetical protein
MTLARMWRRQLLAASSAALIVPSAMIAALVALALGGGFSQLGVLGQVFSGPPAPSAGPLRPGGVTARTSGAPIPVIRVARTVATRPGSGGARTPVAPAVTAPRPGSGVASTGLASTGGTIAPGGVTIRPITGGPPTLGSPPPRPAPVSSSPSPSPNPGPAPSPRPNPVDTVVKAVTSVTSQVPAPVGPAITQTMQSAGTAADTLLSKLP